MADKSIMEILSMPPEERKSRYRAVGIGKVIIDGNEFTDYGAFSFIREKAYVTSPERSADGTIGNLDSYATFVTPRLTMNFSMMSIDSYRTMMKLIYSKNEFLVTCYDVVNNDATTNRMYFATEEMPKLWTIARAINGEEPWVELLGVQDYTVEMIGTNVALDKVSVIYHKNPPDGSSDSTIGSDNVPKNTDVIIGAEASAIVEETFDGEYKFKRWNTKADGTGTTYLNNSVYTVNDALVLYAVWEGATSHTLSFSYGIADPDIGTDYQPIYNKQVQYGFSIGTLPEINLPKVSYNDEEYTVYYNPGWYKTPTKGIGSTPVANNTLYWSNTDSALYALYDTYNYSARYYVDGAYYMSLVLEYNAIVPLPELVKSGYIFDGWYTDNEYTEKFSGNMPPFAITLRARFIPE